jgi:hypothetical protein
MTGTEYSTAHMCPKLAQLGSAVMGKPLERWTRVLRGTALVAGRRLSH